MTNIAIAPLFNSKGKKDVTGAFLPEALEFVRIHQGDLFRFDNTESKRRRRKSVEESIRGAQGMIDTVAIFCHGHKNGLQTGHTLGTAKGLAQAISSVSQPWVSVALYCCDTARDNDQDRKDDMAKGPGGEGGFADRLRDEMLKVGLSGGHVDAHTVVAHTTRAPYVRRFLVDEEAQDLGGDWLVAPGSPLWKTWRIRLREDRKFRLSFPRYTKESVHGQLR